MLQPGGNPNPVYTSTAAFSQAQYVNAGNVNVNGTAVSGGQLIHTSSLPNNVIPTFLLQSGVPTSSGASHIKQEPGVTLQLQNLQNLQGQPGTRLLLTTSAPGAPEGGLLFPAGQRMANGTLLMSHQQSESPGPSGSGSTTGGKGRGGGRRAARDEKLTPEEEERRKVRRERNKQAAARCRKRRMDHTNVLVEEVEGLEEQGAAIRAEIEKMQAEKEEMEYLLQAHRQVCSKEFELPPPAVVVADVEMEETEPEAAPPAQAPVQPPPEEAMPPPAIVVVPDSGTTAPAGKKGGGGAQRPASLPVKLGGGLLDLAMPTPSPTKLIFNFEHSGLTPTGLTPTGLTPLIPSCSTETPSSKSPLAPRPVDAGGLGESVSPNNLVSL
ncbi:fos-related antigen 2-like isoform X2 [Paramacrobiotus metropolitanus]|nr:fos-related antigen 2-like isoform X2 [Paramacrobiotus metropolitanus]XP_055352070.1 fos-related antigen 2-like isoform X2 [Paramacrobiotus metropolitanus]